MQVSKVRKPYAFAQANTFKGSSGIRPPNVQSAQQAGADVFTRKTASDASGRLVPLRFGFSVTEPYGVTFDAAGKARFHLWAPNASQVELVLLRPPGPGEAPLHEAVRPYKQDVAQQILNSRIVNTIPMQADASAPGSFSFEGSFPPGALYMYRLKDAAGNSGPLRPDPRTRYQPEDVHGPSQVVRLDKYNWKSQNWLTPGDKRNMLLYRMHIGTLTKEGTFDAAIKELDRIKSMGFTGVEVMPVTEFPGSRNWGYDVVGFHAVERAYGGPVAYQRFVDACHERGLAVIQDVVYNHVGPEGVYLNEFEKDFSMRAEEEWKREWGDVFNWSKRSVRNFVNESQEAMIRDFRVDGFRYDMSSRIPDDAQREYLAHLFKVKQHLPTGPNLFTAAEDERNEEFVTLPQEHGGLGYSTKWDFPFHHRLGSIVAGEKLKDGDVYSTDPKDLAWLVDEGFPGPIHPDRRLKDLYNRVIFYQSHDEIANGGSYLRGMQRIQKAGQARPGYDRARFLMGSLMKYLVPGVPFNFQGEEYGEKNHFYFFADHLDETVQEGTRNGRKPHYDLFSPKCFNESKLEYGKHRDVGIEQATRQIINFRKHIPALHQGGIRDPKNPYSYGMHVIKSYLDSNVLAIHRWATEGQNSDVFIVANMSEYDYLNNQYRITFPAGNWKEIFNTADKKYWNKSSKYAGVGVTNDSGQLWQGERGISLPAWSISIFQKTSNRVKTPIAKN